MTQTILITDSLFVGAEHEARLREAGFEVVRIDKPKASEDELVEAIRGKVGYILGGIEQVTDRIIQAADVLKVIAFTGSGYSEFIPGYRAAAQKGIAITSAPGGNAISVAEFSLALILMMARSIPTVTSHGGKSFLISQEFSSKTVGIIGYGNIGKEVASKCALLGFKVLVANRSQVGSTSSGINASTVNDILEKADIISLHVNKNHGENVLGAAQISKLKKGSVLVNAAFPHAVDDAAMFKRIKDGEIRAAFDAPPESVPEDLPIGGFVASLAQTAFNTAEANSRTSDMVVSSLLNVLLTGTDKYRVVI